MYDVILDPDIDGCTIWYDGRVTHINGRINEMANEIYKRVSVFEKTDDNKYICYQNKTIGIDTSGFGIAVKECLELKGLQINEIRGRQINTFLPVTNEFLVPINHQN